MSGDAAWVDVAGELDLADAERFAASLREAHARARLVVVDLHQLDFIDVAGVHAIADASSSARADGRRLIVTGALPKVTAVFELTGAAHTIEAYGMSREDVTRPSIGSRPGPGAISG